MEKHLYITLESFISDDIEKYRGIKYSHGEDFFSSFLDIGTKKSVGYLPLSRIKEFGGKDAEQNFIKWSIKKGFKYKKFKNLIAMYRVVHYIFGMKKC